MAVFPQLLTRHPLPMASLEKRGCLKAQLSCFTYAKNTTRNIRLVFLLTVMSKYPTTFVNNFMLVQENVANQRPLYSIRYWEVVEWLTWMQSGIGPMQGQANHFYRYAPEKVSYECSVETSFFLADIFSEQIEYGIKRYQTEVCFIVAWILIRPPETNNIPQRQNVSTKSSKTV